MKMKFLKNATRLVGMIGLLLIYSCGGGSKENKGLGPITSVSLADEIDSELVAEGQSIYNQMCTACHKLNVKYIGPAPAGIMERRSPEWIMNMILNPEGMVAEDPIAKALLIEFYGAPMANQNLSEEQARAVLEYFRTL